MEIEWKATFDVDTKSALKLFFFNRKSNFVLKQTFSKTFSPPPPANVLPPPPPTYPLNVSNIQQTPPPTYPPPTYPPSTYPPPQRTSNSSNCLVRTLRLIIGKMHLRGVLLDELSDDVIRVVACWELLVCWEGVACWPAEKSSPVEKTSPVEISSQVQKGSLVENSSPVENSAPVEISGLLRSRLMMIGKMLLRGVRKDELGDYVMRTPCLVGTGRLLRTRGLLRHLCLLWISRLLRKVLLLTTRRLLRNYR